MSSLDKINVQIQQGNDSTIMSAAASPKPGEITINIQTSEDWVITGKYHDNVLKAISLNKLTYQESEA